MKDNTDKHIESFIEKRIKKSFLESPLPGFTTQVMSDIENLQQSKATTYRPLISRPVWFAIFGSLVILVFHVLFNSNPETSGWLDEVNFSMLSDNKVSETLSKMTFSKTTIYAVVLLAVMLFIQIPLLKSYFDKRL